METWTGGAHGEPWRPGIPKARRLLPSLGLPTRICRATASNRASPFGRDLMPELPGADNSPKSTLNRPRRLAMDHLILPQSLLLHVFLWAALCTLGVASVALRAHYRGRLRDRAVARDAHALALEFARHLSEASHGDDLRRAAAATSPAVFWTALESFTDNVGGEEWDRLSLELHQLPVVRREIAWARTCHARRKSVWEAMPRLGHQSGETGPAGPSEPGQDPGSRLAA